MHRLLRQHVARLRYLQGAAAVRYPDDEQGAVAMRPWIRPALITAGVLLTALQHAAADPAGNDLRDIRIGLSVADLPSAGYAGFSCAADINVKPSGWSGWRDCPAGADGVRA